MCRPLRKARDTLGGNPLKPCLPIMIPLMKWLMVDGDVKDSFAIFWPKMSTPAIYDGEIPAQEWSFCSDSSGVLIINFLTKLYFWNMFVFLIIKHLKCLKSFCHEFWSHFFVGNIQIGKSQDVSCAVCKCVHCALCVPLKINVSPLCQVKPASGSWKQAQSRIQKQR